MGLTSARVPEKLLACASHIRAIRPDDHTVSYVRQRWDKYFSGDAEYMAVVRAHPESLRRGNVFDLARTAVEKKTTVSLKSLFIGTMIWGFGNDNRGPAKTWRFIHFPDLMVTLDAVMRHLASGNYRAAYDCNDIPDCGPAFFTKFLYFAGRGLSVRPMPLI
jgi:hypothetical protein